MASARISRVWGTILLTITICFVCISAQAQTSRYIFLSDKSVLVQTGGIAGVHWTYAIEGQFLLTVDSEAGTASFTQVDANAVDDSPFRRTLDPNEVFNMTALAGTIAEGGMSIQFEGNAPDTSSVLITLTFADETVALKGQTTPPPNSADFFIFTLDAVAQRKYSGGTGEPNDPYQIATSEDLMLLGESPEDYDKHFILTADIDLDPNLPGRKVFDKAVIAPDINMNESHFQGTPFTGVFDGNNHSISHLNIIGQSYLGLFGQLGTLDAPGCEVKNLGLIDVNISGSGNFIGGLVGYKWHGRIDMSCSTGTISGVEEVGGLIGANHGTRGRISMNYSSGSVHGTQNVGGLVGQNYRAGIEASYSSALVSGTGDGVGGLVGWNWGFVTQCYSTGLVSSLGSVGGLVGYNYGGDIDASFWDTQSSGQTTSGWGTGKTTAEMQDQRTYMASGWDFVGQADGPHDIWAKPPDGGYPILWWQLSPLPELPGFSGGSGEPNDPYLIATAEQLSSVGHNPRLMKCHFALVDHLDLTGLQFSPIGGSYSPYAGVFDGDGHTISHVTIHGESYLGLFGRLASGATVRDLGVLDVNIAGSGSCIGGLVGYNDGTIDRSYSTGLVSGDTMEVGGLVGENRGSISSCYSASLVSGGGQHGSLGGLVGWNDGTIDRSYSTGLVSGVRDVGGLVGYDWYRCATASLWDTQTSGQTTSAGGVGKTTAEMQTASTFLEAGWDFVDETANGIEDIWLILEGQDYPRLWWENDNN